MSKRKEKTTALPKCTAVTNFEDFLSRVGIKDKKKFETEVTADHLRIRWNDEHETVFYEGGGWIQRNLKDRVDNYGLYPSGAGHYSQKIRKAIGEGQL